MIELVLAAFLLTAAFGAYMLVGYLGWGQPSDRVSIVHGLMAVVSVALLIGLILETGFHPFLLAAFGSFALAMIVGFLLIGVNLHGEIVEFRVFVVLHILLALTGLSMLVIYFWFV